MIAPSANPPTTMGSSFPVCLDLTIQNGATLTIALTSPLDVFGSVSSGGLVTGELRLRGSGTIDTSGPGVLDSVRIVTGSYTITDALIGNLFQDPAAGVVTINDAEIIGQALFTGAGLIGGPNSSLDCAGSMVVNTSVPTVVPPSTIRLRAAWSNDTSWQPASGKVIFTGTTSTAANVAVNTHWHDFEVLSPLGLTFNGDLIVDGQLTLRSRIIVNGPNVDLGERAGLSFNGELTGSSVTLLRIRDGVTAAGRIQLPNATLDADGDMTFLGSGLLEVGGGVHNISDSLSMAGTLTAPLGATLDFDGSGSISISGSTLVPNARISGTNYTIFAMTVLGNLTQTAGSGALNIASCLVGGNCLFAGDSVNDVSGGVLDAFSNIDWQTVSVVNTPPATISCAGNFSTTATFQPTSGLVEFDGAGIQNVNRPSFTWHSLRINVNSQITTASPVVASGDLDVRGTLTSGGNDIECLGALMVSGSLTANSSARVRALQGLSVMGSLQASAAQLDLDGDLDIAGSVSLGNGDHHASGSLQIDGTLSIPAGQALVLDGAGSINVSLANPFPIVRFAGADYDVAALRCSTLEQLSGDMFIAHCVVEGDASFQGGTLGDLGGGLLEVAGNIAIQTSSAVTSPPATILCSGDFVADSSFAPAAGLVELNGAGAQTITMPAFRWHDLRIEAASIVNTAQSVQIDGALDLRGQLVTTGSSVDIFGNFTLNASGLLQAANASSLGLGAIAQIDGTMLTNSASLAGQGDITVSAGGAAALGAGPHQLFGGLLVQGTWSVPGSSDTQFLGTGTVDIGVTNVMPIATFGGSLYTVASLVVGTELRQTGGTLRIAALTSLGNAVFQGGTVEDAGAGSLDVVGNIDFNTTGLVVTPPEITRCGGDWTSSGTYVPTTGLVQMLGAAPQTITATQLPSLGIGGSSLVSFNSTNVILAHHMVVDGSVTAPAGSLEVRGDLAVNGTGILGLQAGSAFTIGRDLMNNGGTISGPGQLTMTGTGSISGSGSFQNTDLAIVTPAEVGVSGTVALGGSLTMLAGTLNCAAGSSLQIGIDLIGNGGTLRGSSGSSLSIDGNVTINGTSAHAAGVPDISASGDWHAGGSFAPSSGTVTLNGVGDLQAIGGSMAFSNLIIGSNNRLIGNTIDATADSVVVNGGAVLDLGDQQFGITANTVTVDGRLSVDANGELFLGRLTNVVISPTGSLRLVGLYGEPAIVTGPTDGGYSFTIEGAIEAMNYSFSNMGAAGILIEETASVASAPHDLRGGVFANGDSAAGSCLLHINRVAPQELRYVTFEDLGAVNFNVRSTGLGRISFVNDSGNLTGPAFEDDSGAVIDWLPAELTEVSSFTATAALHRTNLDFETTTEIDVLQFKLLRAEDPAGPYIQIAGSPVAPLGASGFGASYAIADAFVVDTTKYYYRLEEELLHGQIKVLGEDFARPWPDQINNTWFVGPGGYPDIASAVAAATPGGNIAVAAGTYAAFTIDKAVRIFPDGSGPVSIDTSLGSFTIRDVPAGSADLAIYDLTVGSAASGFGMEILNCQNVVVLDGLDISASGGVTGLLVDNTTHIAIQGCDFSGGPGLKFDSGSLGYLSRGTINVLEVLGASTLTYCDTTPGAMTVGALSLATPLPDAMPDIQMPVGWPGDKPLSMTVTAQPSSLYIVVFSQRRDFIDLTPIFPIDMVLLVEQLGATTFTAGLVGPSGTTVTSLVAPGGAGSWGLQLPMQVLELRINGTGRMGSSVDICFLP
ncbi:MAG: hypothetical protein VYE77_07655 [Planctomycetota bacterium]|nr:hypothetical protein [Planctomycetota bacterium]